MADKGYLPKEKIKEFVEALGKDAAVYAPSLEGDTIIFRQYTSDKEIALDRPANTPPKGAIYPQCETLLSFEFKMDEATPQKMDIELKTNLDFPKAVVFGGRPCDARGFTVIDRVFINPEASDPYYQKRRENTTIITKCCNGPYAGCFCVGVGGGPASREGSDVVMTEVDGGYYMEAVTDKGKAVMSLPMIQDGASYEAKAKEANEKATAKVRNPFPAGSVDKVSPELFDSADFWDKVIAKCVSCGACTFLCPTCYCFNITDEQAITTGERIRTWDSCMFQHFTLETSGHNPRTIKNRRFRNRVGHKFYYYPEKYENAIACTGCGRCIRYCPVSVDISEIVGYLKDPNADPAQWAAEKKDAKN
jgi:sulfhydrogenase subunit beta (sulfur reductase)